MKLVFSSSGLKAGPLPLGKDHYIDARAIPDPTQFGKGGGSVYTPPFGVTGKDPKLQAWMRDVAPIKAYVEVVKGMLATLGKRRENNPNKHITDPVTIHTFCAWGVHRSVALKHILAREFELMGYVVEVE